MRALPVSVLVPFIAMVPLASRSAEPAKSAKTAKTPRPDRIATAKGDLEIVPVEHASVLLRWGGKAIHVDPAGGPDLFKDLPPADLVLITHEHYDHFDPKSLAAVVREKTVLVVPEVVGDAIEKAGGDLAKAQRKVLANGDKAKVGEIGIETVPAYNLAPEKKRFHEKGKGNGYVLDLAGTKVYVAGDTEDIPEMRALKGIAVAFLPMNLPFTMTPEKAAEAVLAFAPKVVYPYHSRGQGAAPDAAPKKFKSLVEEKSKAIEVRLRDWYPRKASS